MEPLRHPQASSFKTVEFLHGLALVSHTQFGSKDTSMCREIFKDTAAIKERRDGALIIESIFWKCCGFLTH